MARPPTLFHYGNGQVAAPENSVRPWESTGGAMKTGLADCPRATLAPSPWPNVSGSNMGQLSGSPYFISLTIATASSRECTPSLA